MGTNAPLTIARPDETRHRSVDVPGRHARSQEAAVGDRRPAGTAWEDTDHGQGPSGPCARLAELKTRPAALYTSPLERARETAAPTARTLGLRAKTDRGLLECDVGSWTGADHGRVAKLPEWAAVQRWPSGFRFPGGESFAEMWTRANDAVLRLVAVHPGQTIVAVSHADPIKAMVASASGVSLDLFQRIVISPCSISALAFGPGGPHVLCVNSTGSLGELALS
jgi:broad specificity phosphatase PhoE